MCRGAKENLNIKCASVDQNITELSGGNQQKVILGKWLAADSQIIILMNLQRESTLVLKARFTL